MGHSMLRASRTLAHDHASELTMKRDEIVERWKSVQERIEKLDLGGGPADELEKLRDERRALGKAYEAWLPKVAIARCPFTGAVTKHSLDPVGLDGMWWSHHDAVRPLEDELPPTFFSLQGALRLAPTVEVTPFLCKPGPAVPFVIPRLLDDAAGLRAVLSSVNVGQHVAYLVTYFAPAGQPLPRRLNTWGRNGYELTDAKGNYKWGEHAEDPASYDFALAGWIKRGKLSWIAPGDDTLTLRATTDGCPFLDLDGTHAVQHLEAGKVW
jgi:hypothetical protein